MKAVTSISIPGVEKLYSGKVRDIYPVDDKHFMILASDRVSAFDHVFPNGIPEKGVILNTISNLWFDKIGSVNNHVVETDAAAFPKPYSDFQDILSGRAVIVRKAERIDFECVARGYLIGSGWKDYQKTGAVCGIELPKGLRMAEKLEKPIFTPATKEDSGHDMNVSIDVMKKELGDEMAERLANLTISLYEQARDLMDPAGIILADTKFEFGLLDGEIILIDEALTPDSSRFWDKSSYEVGSSPVSYDKQFIRDYLETTDWDKNSPPPPLPGEIVEKTRAKYEEILNRVRTAVF